MSSLLRDVLAHPDFVERPLPARTRVLLWILEVFQEYWSRLVQLFSGELGGLAQTLAILIPLLAVFVAGGFALRRISDRQGGGFGGRGGGALDDRAPATALEWLRLARARQAAGDLRPAATALYRGFLLTLNDRGRLAYHPSKTPGDYARELSGPRLRAGGTGHAGRGGGGEVQRTSGGSVARPAGGGIGVRRADGGFEARPAGGGGGARRAGGGIGAQRGGGPSAASEGRFLRAFQRFSFGQETPTPDAYRRLAEEAKEAGCPEPR